MRRQFVENTAAIWLSTTALFEAGIDDVGCPDLA
jgi:hypothetical protein